MIPESGDIWEFKYPWSTKEYNGPVLVYEYHHCYYIPNVGHEHQFLGLELLTGNVDYFTISAANAKYWEKLA